MRQAIETRYAGPTDHRGARIITRSQAGTITVPWDHALDVEANHVRAAREHARRRGWSGSWEGGGSADGKGYVFCSRAQYSGYAAFELAAVECQNASNPAHSVTDIPKGGRNG